MAAADDTDIKDKVRLHVRESRKAPCPLAPQCARHSRTARPQHRLATTPKSVSQSADRSKFAILCTSTVTSNIIGRLISQHTNFFLKT